MKTINLKIKGMHCNSCNILISDALADIGVKKCAVDVKKGTAIIAFDENKLTTEQIKSAIKKEGYDVV